LSIPGYASPHCCEDGPYSKGNALVCRCGGTMVLVGQFGPHAVKAWNDHCQSERAKHEALVRNQPRMEKQRGQPVDLDSPPRAREA
jgi:hypothetical protein